MFGPTRSYSYWMSIAGHDSLPVFLPIISVPRDSCGAIPFTTGTCSAQRAIAGRLTEYVPGGLTLTFVVLLVALIAAVAVVARAPEGHTPAQPRPHYRPQRLRAPAQARAQFGDTDGDWHGAGG